MGFYIPTKSIKKMRKKCEKSIKISNKKYYFFVWQ